MAYIDDRIERVKARILAYEDAIDAFLLHGVSQYTLTTGQTTQQVTRASLPSLEKMLQLCINDLAILDARKNGGGASYVRGAW